MTNQAYEFNKDAAYRVGSFYSREKQVNLLSLNIFVSSSASFATRFPDVFGKYKLPYVESDQLVQAWSSTPMQWWQNQVNFAVWCATSGCGVSAQDHLAAAEPLMQSVYQFHTYYQVRRILAEIGAALPQDQAWDAFKNLYNRRSYERICNEFGVDVNSDWRQKQSNNQGLGTVFNYWTRNGYHVVEDGAYHAEKMSFTQTTTNDIFSAW
jgi:hypothetical protein